MTTKRIHHVRRLTAVALTALLAVTLTACGDDEPKTEPTTTASDSPEDDVESVHRAFWDVYVQAANSGEVTSTIFNGIAEGGFVERDLKVLGDQADAGVVRVGKPTYSDYQVEVDGDRATSLVCVDFDGWGGKDAQGEKLPDPPATDPSPFLAELENRDGTWIMTDQLYQKDTPCP